MAKEEPPAFILPKKRNGKKQGSINGHVDHIITVQGAADEVPVKYMNGLSPVTENETNIIQISIEELKNTMKINLPIINDDEDMNDANTENSEKHHVQKNGYQAVSTNNSRDIIDLSPIYENSSDACSSHGDLKETENELHKSCKVLNLDNIESSSATPSSFSQTQSENSFEMGNLSDSLKSSAKKKKANIVIRIPECDNTGSEITPLRVDSEESILGDSALNDNTKDDDDGYFLTITGTIKRSKKKVQNDDVTLNISQEKLKTTEAAIVAEEYNTIDVSKCCLYNGPHIFLLSLVCFPFVVLISGAYSFYTGTATWYNIFTHINEKMTCVKKFILAPIVVLLYPFLIPIFTVGLGLYAGIVQLTFSGANWCRVVWDVEKGFYGWLCNMIGMSECCPYEVIM